MITTTVNSVKRLATNDAPGTYVAAEREIAVKAVQAVQAVQAVKFYPGLVYVPCINRNHLEGR